MLQVLTTFVAAVSCITAMVSASRIEGKRTLERIEVHISSGKKYHAIEEKQILDETINSRNLDIMHIPVEKLDIQSMERTLRADPWVADASLYIDARKVLHMSVIQRIPIARLFLQNGTSCYMDNTLSLMPLAPNFIFYTPVVTNVPILSNDSTSLSVKKQVALLVRNIMADTFWNAQVSQIIVDSDFSFELVPVLGQQRILFGDTSRMKEKFNDLYVFYTSVLNKIGWDKYESLNVKFKGQVIASPSLPYKGPVDKANASMNWVNSIVETEARIDSMHTQRAEAHAKTHDDNKQEDNNKAAENSKGKKEPPKNSRDNKKATGKTPAPAKDKVGKKDDKKEHGKTKDAVKKDDRKKDKKDVKKEKKKEERKPKYTLPENREH